MTFKIVNIDLFCKSNGIFGIDKSLTKIEYEVLAICEEHVYLKKQKKYLIILYNQLFWCHNNSSILIVNNEIPTNWKFTKKFRSGYVVNSSGLSYFQKIILKNLFCPQWMINDKEFFLDIIENLDRAYSKFVKYNTL